MYFAAKIMSAQFGMFHLRYQKLNNCLQEHYAICLQKKNTKKYKKV